MKFLKQADYVGYVNAKLTKHVKISMQRPSEYFYRGSFKIEKSPRTNFHAKYSYFHVMKNFWIRVFFCNTT